MNLPKGIIFDCDGTIVDSEQSHYDAWRETLQKYGKDLPLDVYRTLAGQSTENLFASLTRILKIEGCPNIGKEKMEYYLELAAKGVPPIQETYDFIHKLISEKKRYGYKIAVASASPKTEISHHLKHLQIEDLFDAIISGRDDLSHYNDPEGVNKPKPYVYMHAAKMLGLSPSECIAIEDTSNGVRAAADAGCFTIAIPNSFTRGQDFSRASLKIDSLAGMDVQSFLSLPIMSKRS